MPITNPWLAGMPDGVLPRPELEERILNLMSRIDRSLRQFALFAEFHDGVGAIEVDEGGGVPL